MSDQIEHFDEDLDSRVGSKLAEDLSFLFGPSASVGPEVDRAVIDRANRHFVRRGRRRPWPRWAASAVAAAAVIILAAVLEPRFSPTPDQESLSEKQLSARMPAKAALATDIDRNGRVDILDAFKLARHIESAEVREAKWDINGDGLVDRADVDVVAFAAVRLDKGV